LAATKFTALLDEQSDCYGVELGGEEPQLPWPTRSA
jgi:hypothetical protein